MIGKVQAIAKGGAGIIRESDRTVFVPGVIAGETVEYAVCGRRQSVWQGKLLRVAEASPTWGVPSDLDVAAFVRTAKVQFVRLQAAYDAADLNDLREFTTPEMYAELKLDVDERKGAANRTDVVTLDAQLLGVETTAVEHIASVRFTGMIREEADGEARPFDEVWNLVKPVSGAGGWVLAGIQQLG